MIASKSWVWEKKHEDKSPCIPGLDVGSDKAGAVSEVAPIAASTTVD